MADKAKGQTIVIKKITVAAGGAHGGGWKVAFADFMTAMMCFFLVMWLLNQSEPVKKQVASYFSGPSILEQQLTSYGAELTLEKLFLDLVNEPLKAVQTIMLPADFTPNLMAMGSKKLVLHHIAEELGPVAKNVNVTNDEVSFEIADVYLFEKGTSNPSPQFTDVMERIKVLTAGLEDSRVEIESQLFDKSVPDGNPMVAKNVALKRLEIIKGRVEASLEYDNVDVLGKTTIQRAKNYIAGGARPNGMIKISMKQKEFLANGKKPRPLKDLFGSDKSGDMSTYNEYVKRVSEEKKNKRNR